MAPKYYWGFVAIVLAILTVVGATLLWQSSFQQQAIDGNNNNRIIRTIIGTKEFNLEVVDSNMSRTQGLSGRQALASDEGMLFIFDKSKELNFWMKDMNFAIDIAWLNEDKEIIYIKNSAKPEDYPESYSAGAPSLYVVEVPAHTFNNLGVNIGDTINF